MAEKVLMVVSGAFVMWSGIVNKEIERMTKAQEEKIDQPPVQDAAQGEVADQEIGDISL